MIIDGYANDANCAVSWRARPGAFVSLMALYESNYIRLSWLIPDLSAAPDQAVSRATNDCPLHLSVIERSRYTTTLRLTYVFEDAAGVVADPDLIVRVYHDARLVEAQSCSQWRQHAFLEALRSKLARDLGDRWLRNIMLNKWLDYCIDRGHRFLTPAH